MASSMDISEEFSVEVGRAMDSIHSSDAMVGEYRVMYTPPRSPPRTASKNLRKDASLRLASIHSQKENQHPTSVRPGVKDSLAIHSNKSKRRTLGEIYTQATEGYEGSMIANDRPQLAKLAPTKNTRFGSISQTAAPPRRRVDTSARVETASDINHSIVVPDLLSLSKLVPSASPYIQPRGSSTRFYSVNASTYATQPAKHMPVEEVPIPADEQQLFVSIKMLQDELQNAKLIVQTLTQERDDALNNNDEMEGENQRLTLENQQLKAQLAQLRLSARHEEHFHQQERRRAPDARSILSKNSPQKSREARVSGQVNENLAILNRQPQNGRMFSVDTTQPSKSKESSSSVQRSQRRENLQPEVHEVPRGQGRHSSALSSRKAKQVVIDADPTIETEEDMTGVTDTENMTRNLTYLSEVPSNPAYTDLRRQIEQERIASRQTQQVTSTVPLGVKQDRLQTAAGVGSASTKEEVTGASNTSRRRRRASTDENMTSAFIIPDITMAPVLPTSTAQPREQTVEQTQPRLSDQVQDVLHHLDTHEASGCDICSRLAGQAKKVTIPKPTAVSDRIMESSNTQTPSDPTIRPSRSPAEQLAIVLKTMEDELKVCKDKALEHQLAYNRMDPPLSQRMREKAYQSLHFWNAKCRALSKNIDRLYDVLEGQKAAGMEMTQKEVDLTLTGLDWAADHHHDLELS